MYCRMQQQGSQLHGDYAQTGIYTFVYTHTHMYVIYMVFLICCKFRSVVHGDEEEDGLEEADPGTWPLRQERVAGGLAAQGGPGWPRPVASQRP